MDDMALRSLVDNIIADFDCAAVAGNEERMQSLADNLHLELSKESLSYSNFYRRLTHDVGAEASKYRILQGHLLNVSCPLDNGKHDKPPKPRGFRKIFEKRKKNKNKGTPCGLFDALPQHILQIILEEAAINDFSKYATILRHAPQILRAALSINAAPAFTCRELWTALVNKECACCGEFGGFLYLPTCSRVCFWCGMKSEHCRLLPLESVKRYYSITKYELVKYGVAIIHPLPGHYHNSTPDPRDVGPLVDMTAAATVASEVYGVDDDPDLANIEVQILKQEHYEKGISTFPGHSEETIRKLIYKPELEFIKRVPDLQWYCPGRLKCLTPFPWLDTNNIDGNSLITGVSCVACGHKRVVMQEPDLLPGPHVDFAINGPRLDYSHRDFIKHFLTCRHARRWWSLNPHGLPPIPGTPPMPRILHFSMVPHEQPEKPYRLWNIFPIVFKVKKPRFLAFMGTKKARGLSFHQPNFTS